MLSESIFVELGKVLSNPCSRLKVFFEKKKNNKQRQFGMKMAVLSGSIRRVK